MTKQDPFKPQHAERVLYSREFRGLQDKTQLFYPSQQHRVRTRLTHTIEVRTIAHKIAVELNEKIEAYNADPGKDKLLLADLELVDTIALAHDIGHTPFGHVGERTIDAVVSGEDDLGGLIHTWGATPMRFKHNVNGARILVDLYVTDWRVIEGTLAHTRICYKGDDTKYQKNPYQPFANSAYNRLMEFICSHNGLDFAAEKKVKNSSLTLEGQIVAIADEIAQRIADLSDGNIQTRYLDVVSKALNTHLKGRYCPAHLRGNPYTRLEWELFNAMTLAVVEVTFDNLQQCKPDVKEHVGIKHAVYTKKVVDFAPEPDKQEDAGEKKKSLNEMDMREINDELDDFISACLAQSEDVRESDSRSKYIIRQLFKAYINDVTLLPDAFLKRHLNSIANANAFKEALAETTIPEPADVEKEKGGKSADQPVRNISKTFNKVRTKAWDVDNAVTRPFNKKLFDMELAKAYFEILKTNNANEARGNQKISVLFDAFILDVAFHIAGMTNTEAFDAYNRIYGHTP